MMLEKNTLTEQVEIVTALLRCKKVIVTSAGGAPINPPKDFTEVHGREVGAVPDFEKYRYEVVVPRTPWDITFLPGSTTPTWRTSTQPSFELQTDPETKHVVLRQLREVPGFEFVPYTTELESVVEAFFVDPRDATSTEEVRYAHACPADEAHFVERVVRSCRQKAHRSRDFFRTARMEGRQAWTFTNSDVFRSRRYRLVVPTRQFVLFSRGTMHGDDMLRFTLPLHTRVVGDTFEYAGMVFDVIPVHH